MLWASRWILLHMEASILTGEWTKSGHVGLLANSGRPNWIWKRCPRGVPTRLAASKFEPESWHCHYTWPFLLIYFKEVKRISNFWTFLPNLHHSNKTSHPPALSIQIFLPRMAPILQLSDHYISPSDSFPWMRKLLALWLSTHSCSLLLPLLLLSIPLMILLLLLLRQLTGTVISYPQFFSPIGLVQTPEISLEKLEKFPKKWPLENPTALLPELTSLPTPTIRRCATGDRMPASSGQKITFKAKTWPTAGDLLRRETVEEVNRCRRHIVLFERRVEQGR